MYDFSICLIISLSITIYAVFHFAITKVNFLKIYISYMLSLVCKIQTKGGLVTSPHVLSDRSVEHLPKSGVDL